jgi:hypothetical protein
MTRLNHYPWWCAEYELMPFGLGDSSTTRFGRTAVTYNLRLALRVMAAVFLAVGLVVTFVPQQAGNSSLWTYSRTDNTYGPCPRTATGRSGCIIQSEKVPMPFSSAAIAANNAPFTVSLVLLILGAACFTFAATAKPRLEDEAKPAVPRAPEAPSPSP